MKDTIVWKRVKINDIEIKKSSLKKKQVKVINKILKEHKIRYDTVFNDIAPYIKEYKENSFKTYEMPMDELKNALFPRGLDINSRFSIISDKESMQMPDILKDK